MGDKVEIERVDNGFILRSHHDRFVPRMTYGKTEVADTIEHALGIAYRMLFPYAKAPLTIEHMKDDSVL